MERKIAVLPGDGIGPEVIEEGVKVLKEINKKYALELIFEECLVGGAAYDQTGHPLPKETTDICDSCAAIYFGAIGGPKWEKLPPELTPEKGAILAIRKRYDFFANLRPAVIFGPLASAASLKEDRLPNGLDLLIVRELTGGIYFGKKERKDDWALDELKYSVWEIERIVKVACEAAMKRNKKLTSIDKANVLATSKLWREVTEKIVKQNYPQIELVHMYVDNAAMQLATRPTQFDVIVTENMFGDILSDEASAVTGSIGMLPSASLNEKMFGLYEPIHGSAPDIAGKGIANPLATILSGAMMLKYSFGLVKESTEIENAVRKVLEKGHRTIDIASKDTPKENIFSTSRMGDAVVQEIARK
jgi:3-isopropylmalate dehydrogenase